MRKLSYLFIALFFATACEKIVDLEIPSEDPRLVVESQITDKLSYWEVKLNLSQPYFDQDSASDISDAIVSITGTDGADETLAHIGDGLYRSANQMQCGSGETYTLTIEYKGTTYVANEETPNGFPIDLILSYFLPNNNGFIESGYYVFIKGEENEYKGDSYLWNFYVNDTLKDNFGYLLEDDEFGEVSYLNPTIDPDDPLAGIAQNILPRPFPFKVLPGDSINIEQYNLSPLYYEYLQDLQNQLNRSGSPFDPPPANLNNNISNGALGYFSVASRFESSIVIEP